MVSWSRTNAPGNRDLTLSGAEFEELKSLRILRITLDFELRFVAHCFEGSQESACYVPSRKLIWLSTLLKCRFSAYDLPSLEYWAPM